ncbi:MAG: GNAT family N-acetyltransferase [Prolixibacteraceae bacterium]
MGDMVYRNTLKETDRDAFKNLLESTGVFYDFEIDVALEITDTFLSHGEASGYFFYVAEQDEEVIAYINFGPTPCTRASWDIYWMAVTKDLQGHGLGKILIKMAEDRITAMKGENIWIETSSRAEYLPTRQFYVKTAYTPVSELHDFYDRGDNKVIFVKYLNPSR